MTRQPTFCETSFREAPAGEPAREVTLVTGSGSVAPGEGSFEAMLTAALDGVVELSGAERGMVSLFDADGRLLVERARSRDRRDVSGVRLPVAAVLEKVGNRATPLWNRADAGSAAPRETHLGRLLVACAPIHYEGRPCGLVYLEHSGAALSRESLVLAQSLAQLASVAAARGADRGWRWRCVDATPWLDPRWDLN